MEATRDYVMEKLNNENYDIWSIKMEMMLIKEDLWNVVEDDLRETGSEAWKKKNGKTLVSIILSIDNGQIGLVKKCKTAKDAWDLMKNFHVKSCLSTTVSVLKRIRRLELPEGGDMEQHLFKLEELFDKLSAAGKELDEDIKVAIMLSSLPDSYEVLTTALEARSDDELTLGIIKQQLIAEWRKRGLSNVSKDNKEDSKALKVMNRRKVRCYHCDQVGHIKSRCYKWLELQQAEKDKEKDKYCLY
jgi:hypothetical protein